MILNRVASAEREPRHVTEVKSNCHIAFKSDSDIRQWILEEGLLIMRLSSGKL